MNLITHALSGWCLAESIAGIGRGERALIVGATIVSDLDGFGAIPELLTRNTSQPLFWWTDYHHVLAHNITFALVVGVLGGIAAARRRALVGAFCFLAVHLHLLEDLLGSRGPDGYEWPIPYLYPFRSEPKLVWAGEWPLNGWQNISFTVALLFVTFVLAWYRGYSPLGLVSPSGDARFIETLRNRFPRRA